MMKRGDFWYRAIVALLAFHFQASTFVFATPMPSMQSPVSGPAHEVAGDVSFTPPVAPPSPRELLDLIRHAAPGQAPALGGIRAPCPTPRNGQRFDA